MALRSFFCAFFIFISLLPPVWAQFSLDVNVTSGEYIVSVGGVTWFSSGASWVTINGQQFLTGRDLSVSSSHSYTAQDALGEYKMTSLSWADSANEISFVTNFRVYTSGDNIVFEQVFPTGLNGTAAEDTDHISTAFPVFVAHDLSTGQQRGFLSYQGPMVGTPTGGIWGNSTGYVAGSLADSGPVLVFDTELNNTVVISPFSNFMAASRYFYGNGFGNGGQLAYGTMGGITSIPAEYSVSFILHLSSGINQAMMGWGDQLLTNYNKKRDARTRDFTLQYLGYSTDNGAYYYYHTLPNATYQDTILAVYNYSMSIDVPYKYILLDSWWYFKGPHDGVVNWTAMPSVFPNNLTWLYAQTGWPVQGHNRFWSYATNYAKQNGGPWDFIVETETNLALPNSQAFWDWLMRQSREWGLIVYEQDWLDVQFPQMHALTQSATLGRQWLMQMGTGAQRSGLTIQYCMSWGRHILQSVEVPAVSNARASDDYMQERNQQWKIGESSLFAWAVGLAPSKDNYWSTMSQPGNPWNDTEPYSPLQSAVLSLSMGPVAVGDGIGYSNASLIMRCCMSDGTLLSPDSPATAIDTQLLQHVLPLSGPIGQIWSTTTTIDGYTWQHVIVPELNGSYTLTMNDLRMPASKNQSSVIYDNSGTMTPATFGSAGFNLNTCSPSEFQLFHVAPVFWNGWSLLGEVGKWVRVSQQRFPGIVSIDSDDVSLQVVGHPGESISVLFAQGSNIVTVSCTINNASRMTLSLQKQGCF